MADDQAGPRKRQRLHAECTSRGDDGRRLLETISCSICHEPFVDPVTLRASGHTYCRPCITQALAVQSRCPLSNAIIEVDSDDERGVGGALVANHAMRALVDSQPVACKYASRGCTARPAVSEADAHEATCAHAPKKCSRCPFVGSRVEVDEHERSCPFVVLGPTLDAGQQRLEAQDARIQGLEGALLETKRRVKELEAARPPGPPSHAARNVLVVGATSRSMVTPVVRGDATVSELLHACAAESGCSWRRLVLADVWENKIHRFFALTDCVDETVPRDELVAYVAAGRDTKYQSWTAAQAYYPWTARQPVWRRQLCVPYDDRVRGYHAREDAREKDPLLATSVFNVGGTYYGEYNCSKEARACRFEVTGSTLLGAFDEAAATGAAKVMKVEELKSALESAGADTEGTEPELVKRLVAAQRASHDAAAPAPAPERPNSEIKIVFDFITGNGAQGAYWLEGTYDATTREARVHPRRWIKKPDKAAATMVPLTLRVCGGDDGPEAGPLRLVGFVDQCGPVVAWAAGERDDPQERSPWDRPAPEDAPEPAPARPASHVGVVAYHRVENKGFRGVPTLCAMPRVDDSDDDVSYDVALRRLLSARGDCSRAVIKRVDQKGANLASPPTWGDDPLTSRSSRASQPCQPFVEYVSMVWPDAASCDAFAAGEGRTVAESRDSDEASSGDSS